MQTTDTSLRNQTIYSIYVRNHTEAGTLRAIEDDLGRIKALGTDIIWLMPIHPVGVEGKKGSLGCPYSISDYRAVNPEYGTIDDLRHLVDRIHALGMKCIIDVVYNHTSRDSGCCAISTEFYWKAADGSMGNRFGDWTDVYDLDYSCRELWDYQVQTLRFWAGIVDGFRCDVASCVTPEFWTYARKAVSDVNPDCIWLAETVHRSFVIGAREQGLQVWSDSEIFTAFDISYQYDIHEKFMACFEGSQTMETALSAYIDAVNSQEFIYPANFVKLRFVENHDNERFATLCPDRKKRMEWLRFMFFQKGTMLIYGGQEFSCTHTPSLFEKETFPRTGEDISATIADLAKMKKSLPTDAVFQAKVVKGTHVEASYISNGKVVAKQEFDL